MATFETKALVLMQLSLLLSSFILLAEGIPVLGLAKGSVALPPQHPPPPPPPHLPPYPNLRKFMAVAGVVLCKSCKFVGQDNLYWSTPIVGGVVRVECKTKYGNVNETGVTDTHGFFFITPKNILWDAHRKCKAYLVSSSNPSCSVPTNLSGGITGASLNRSMTLRPAEGVPYPTTFELYTVGPFGYEPKYPCH